jgi:hypothetical protein
MIASIAIAEGLPLYTTNPDDFVGLEQLLTIVPVRRPVATPGSSTAPASEPLAA